MTTYKMPAEWEKQEAIILAWPHNKSDWPGKFEPIKWVFVEIIRYIAAGQRVRLIVKDSAHKKDAVKALTMAHINLDKIDFYIIPTNRGWLRDSGPIFVKDAKGKKTLLNFKFNAWAKYSNNKLDDKVPEELNKHCKLPIVEPVCKGKRVVLEGGSIEVNGKGTLITTEECLLSKVQERNPHMNRDDYEAVFAKYLGINDVIWLGNGVAGDDTHGHVDDLSRFVNEKTIVTIVENNRKDVNFAPLQNNLKKLKKTKFEIVELPCPKAVMFDGLRLPASYANFLITNKTVLVPTFNDVADREALNILGKLFKTREVIGINASDLIWGLGTIHCMTQQEIGC